MCGHNQRKRWINPSAFQPKLGDTHFENCIGFLADRRSIGDYRIPSTRPLFNQQGRWVAGFLLRNLEHSVSHSLVDIQVSHAFGEGNLGPLHPL